MRAIIIEDKDCLALVKKMSLAELQAKGRLKENTTVDEMHRLFHYELTLWLQEQGWAGPWS